MPGIIITPGIFNPRATPAESNLGIGFPRKKVVTLMPPWMQQQWSTRTKPVDPGVDVLYVFRDMMGYGLETGKLTVKLDLSAPIPFSKHYLNTRGIRYAIDDAYEITERDGIDYIYSAKAEKLFVAQPGVGTPEFPSAAYPEIAPIEIGGHTIEQGPSPLSGYMFSIHLSYEIEVEGVADDGTYEVGILDGHFSGEARPEGELILRFEVQAGPPPTYENEIEVDRTLGFGAFLRRNGVIIDQIYMDVQITGHITVNPVDVLATMTPPPVVVTEEVMKEVLYGKTADNVVGRQPTIMATVGYARESLITQGKVTAS